MPSSEKFMFDTIFDELETIMPKLVEAELPLSEKAILEAEPAVEIAATFSEEELNLARQDGFAIGKAQGESETLAGIEKTTNDMLATILDNLSKLFSEQVQANQDISADATALSLAIVRKFFPTLNEKSALDEIMSTVIKLLDRLIDEPRILIKVNPATNEDLARKLTCYFEDKLFNDNLIVVADKSINLGDCKIEWSNGTAERNLSSLMLEVDDIIAQNSTTAIEPSTTVEEATPSISGGLNIENKNIDENIKN